MEKIITLNWADIPVGTDEPYGQIEVEIVSPTPLKVIKDSGGFGLSEWR